jgi:NhaP-type Na+/H+ or K+/H+ antiporter
MGIDLNSGRPMNWKPILLFSLVGGVIFGLIFLCLGSIVGYLGSFFIHNVAAWGPTPAYEPKDVVVTALLASCMGVLPGILLGALGGYVWQTFQKKELTEKITN